MAIGFHKFEFKKIKPELTQQLSFLRLHRCQGTDFLRSRAFALLRDGKAEKQITGNFQFQIQSRKRYLPCSDSNNSIHYVTLSLERWLHYMAKSVSRLIVSKMVVLNAHTFKHNKVAEMVTLLQIARYLSH